MNKLSQVMAVFTAVALLATGPGVGPMALFAQGSLSQGAKSVTSGVVNTGNLSGSRGNVGSRMYFKTSQSVGVKGALGMDGSGKPVVLHTERVASERVAMPGITVVGDMQVPVTGEMGVLEVTPAVISGNDVPFQSVGDFGAPVERDIHQGKVTFDGADKNLTGDQTPVAFEGTGGNGSSGLQLVSTGKPFRVSLREVTPYDKWIRHEPYANWQKTLEMDYPELARFVETMVNAASLKDIAEFRGYKTAPDATLAGRYQEKITPAVHPEMIKNLTQGGLSQDQIIADISDLGKPDAAKVLKGKGWTAEKAAPGYRAIYSVGQASLYLHGQRAAFAASGEIRLISFAGVFMQVITMDKDGRVTANQVTQLDRGHGIAPATPGGVDPTLLGTPAAAPAAKAASFAQIEQDLPDHRDSHPNQKRLPGGSILQRIPLQRQGQGY